MAQRSMWDVHYSLLKGEFGRKEWRSNQHVAVLACSLQEAHDCVVKTFGTPEAQLEVQQINKHSAKVLIADNIELGVLHEH